MAINAGDAIWRISGDIGDLQSALSEATSAVQSTTSEAESAATIAISGDSTDLDTTLDSVASDVSSTVSDASGDATVEVSGDSTDLDTTLESVAGNVSSIVEDASGNAVVTVAGDTGELDSTLESVASSVSSIVEDASGNAVVTVAGDVSELDSALDEISGSVSSAVEDASSDATVEVSGDAAPLDEILSSVTDTVDAAIEQANAAAFVEVTADGSAAVSEIEDVANVTQSAMDEANAAAHVEATVDVSEVTAGMDEATNAVAAAADEMNMSLESIGKGATIAGLAITGILGATVGVFGSVGDEIHKMSLRTGISTEALSKMKFVMEQNGAGLQQFEMATRYMVRTLDEAGQGTEMQVDALARLGLTYEQLSAMSPEEQFKTIAFAIGGLSTHTDQAAAAMEVFGARTGTQLLPMIKAGAVSFEELTARAEELGMVFDQTAANEAAAYTDSMNELKHSFQGVMIELGPIIGKLMEELLPIIKDVLINVREWIAENPNLTASLIAIGGASGLLMDALGPLLYIIPSILTYFKMSSIALGMQGLAGAATVATPAITGVGTAAATAAGATGVGALVAGLAAIAWPVAAGVAIVAGVAAIAYSLSATKKAFDDLEVSEQKSAAMGERYAQHLRDKGIAFNEAAMAAMGLSERVAYGAEAEKQAADTSARAWFQHFAGRAETEKEFANMRALMLNKNISAEEAAIAISKGMNEQAMQELMRADATKTEQILNSMGVLKQADQQSILDITKAEMDAAQERSNIWMQSTEQLVASEQQKAQQVAGFWSTTFGEILHGIMALPVMGGDLVRGLVGMPALGAMAAGGPVAANTPYLVGERGPELFQPSISGRIFNHGETMGMLAGAGADGITVNMNGVNISSNMDVDAVARRLGDKLRQRITGVGASNDWRR